MQARSSSGASLIQGIVRGQPFWRLMVPWWMLCFLFSMLPTAWFMIRRGTRQARSASRCSQCDYDLTGNVSGVCPECGTHT